MELPPDAELVKLKGRDLLTLAAHFLEAEGGREVALIDRMETQYGEGSVGREMHVRAGMFFALALLFSEGRAKAEGDGARKVDGELASRLVGVCKSAFYPKPEVKQNAA